MKFMTIDEIEDHLNKTSYDIIDCFLELHCKVISISKEDNVIGVEYGGGGSRGISLNQFYEYYRDSEGKPFVK